MKTITFTVHRTAWTEYEAMVPDDFDTSDFVDMLELADHPDTKEIAGETEHLNVHVGEKVL